VQRAVHFSPAVINPAGDSETPRHRTGRQSLNDPFISGGNATAGSSGIFLPNTQVCDMSLFLNLILDSYFFLVKS
jgi:hypothetical protein